MKKLLSCLLAVAMLLSVMTFTVSAVDGVSKSAQGITVTIDKSNYQPGEKIYYGWSGVDGRYEEISGVLWATLAISKAGSVHDDYIDNAYADTESAEINYEGTNYFTAPAEDGAYEIRFYWTCYCEEQYFVLSIPITVGAVKTGAISLPKTDCIANETMIVEYSGITSEMVSGEAFVGIYKDGDDIKGWTGYDYEEVKEGSGQVELSVPNINGKFEIRLYNASLAVAGEKNLVMRVPFNITGATASEWAVSELEKAEEMGLIPEILDGADLTADITRAEFAAVAVKVYEALANGKAIPAVINPFTDTNDVEILKAYNIGAVNGTSATTYSPNDLLNREQAAAMLTRVFKKVSIPNWTLATDSQFALSFEKPALFADDADISDWAKDSVYFMVANGIINGVGNNKFAPKNVTSADEANGYANATREQALIIAVRMVENLKK